MPFLFSYSDKCWIKFKVWFFSTGIQFLSWRTWRKKLKTDHNGSRVDESLRMMPYITISEETIAASNIVKLSLKKSTQEEQNLQAVCLVDDNTETEISPRKWKWKFQILKVGWANVVLWLVHSIESYFDWHSKGEDPIMRSVKMKLVELAKIQWYHLTVEQYMEDWSNHRQIHGKR